MKYLALGIAPSSFSSCMRMGKLNFTGPQRSFIGCSTCARNCGSPCACSPPPARQIRRLNCCLDLFLNFAPNSSCSTVAVGRLHPRRLQGRRSPGSHREYPHGSTRGRRHGSGPTVDISLGSVLTDSGTADGEVQALNDRMFLRYRHWMDLWLQVHVGNIYEPITMSQIPILRIVIRDDSNGLIICQTINMLHNAEFI